MACWKTDECPVEDPSKFTKAWQVRSAERNPTMETHFDSEVGVLTVLYIPLVSDAAFGMLMYVVFSCYQAHCRHHQHPPTRK